MNRTNKRPAKYKNYRARSPKRRRLDATQHELEQRESTESDTLSKAKAADDKLWDARAILKERGKGQNKQYQIDWEGIDPDTGRPYEPTWEPSQFVTKALLKDWENKKRADQSARDTNYTPSNLRSSSDPIATAPLSRSRAHGTRAKNPPRRKRPTRIVDDSSSELEPTIQSNTHERTPALDSDTASTPVDDSAPGSPSLEILETQNPHSEPADFSLEIPPASIAKSEYESYYGSQLPYSLNSPVASSKSPPAATSTSSRRNLNSSAKLNRPAVSSPLSRNRTRFATETHLKLQSAVQTSHPPSNQQVQIPQSSETVPAASASSVQNSTPQVVASSLPSKPSQTDQRESSPVQRQSPSTGGTSPNRLDSSAQQLSQPSVLQNSVLSRSLKPLAQVSQIESLASSQPWVFRTQAIPLASTRSKSSLAKAATHSPVRFHSDASDAVSLLNSSQQLRPAMDAAAVRQSPRLRASTPVRGPQSPRIAPREQLHRPPTPQRGDEASRQQEQMVRGNISSLSSQGQPAEMQDIRSNRTTTPSFTSARPYGPDSSESADPSPQQHSYDPPYGASALPIQQSIEEEPTSSAEDASIASKASSSQASLDNERVIPQVDGVSLPLQPVLGPAEYTIALPAEGKIQSAYADTIKAKRKTILKFINRRDSVGSANGSTSRTNERNEMIELVDRLHDTTTHFDLALPGFATQYSISSEEHTAFAKYAGAKFAFLGCLVDALASVDCSIVIASKPGPVQQMIEDFLHGKHVHVTKHDRPTSARSKTPDYHQRTLKVDLVDTTSDIDIHVSSRPLLLIAFDVSFDNQSPQIRRIRELNSRGRNQLLPVIHLLTSNSSEHIDRCLRKAMPSPQRLKLLVRGTYQAKGNLGGQPTYVPDPSDSPEDTQMSLDDLQRAVRKSPNRKLNMMAHIVARAAIAEDFEQYWSLGPMPEVQYEELEDTPPKLSERSTTVGTANATPRDGRARSRTPLSRAGTPSGKKRLLDPDDIRIQSVLSKRQRMSPLRDFTPVQEIPKEQASETLQLRELIKSLQAEVTTERQAKLKAQADLEHERMRSNTWESSHNDVMHRFDNERRKRQKLAKEKKLLQADIDSGKEKQEKIALTNANLKEQIAQLKTELNTAREELKSSSVPELAAIETARSEARAATAKATSLEKQLENRNTDFEYTRQQYQQASNRAAELGGENTELEAQVKVLTGQASDEKRRLKQIAIDDATKADRRRIDQLEQEKKVLEKLLKKTREEVEVLRKGRGVQTRGSSVQPPGSPGLGMVGAAVGTRSRQNSPAPHVMSSAADARRDAAAAHREVGGHGAVANSRVSGLRREQ